MNNQTKIAFRFAKQSLFVFAILLFSITYSIAQETDAPSPEALEEGESLFKGNCVSCHKIWKDMTGPQLNGVTARRPQEDLIAWIKNPAKVLASEDPKYDYFDSLFVAWDGSIMNPHEFMSNSEVKNILAYITAETAKGPPPEEVDGPDNLSKAEEPAISYNMLLGIIIVLSLVILALLGFMVSRLEDLLKSKIADSEVDPENYEQAFEPKFALSMAPVHRVGFALTVLFLLFCGAYYYGYKEVGIQQGYAPAQPIAFSHKIHAGEHQIECSYCHVGVERGKNATIPAANVCMNCHNPKDGIKKDSEEIAKIHEAIDNNRPIEWIRIHNLSDLAYFNHYQHYKIAGIECQKCHGPIEEMTVVEQHNDLTMGWCIDCHRETPVKFEENDYYKQVHADKWDAMDSVARAKGLTIAELGGMECSKCHY